MAYRKTEIGQRTFKDRSVPLTPRQRSAFILFDGRRGVTEVLAATAGLGVTRDDIDHMLNMGLLEGTPGAAPGAQASGFLPSDFGAPSQPMPLEGASRPMPLEASRGASRPAPLDATPVSVQEGQERYKRAYPIATQLTASLGLRGFRLNLAVEAAGSYPQLLELLPRIRDAVGADKARPLEAALRGH